MIEGHEDEDESFQKTFDLLRRIPALARIYVNTVNCLPGARGAGPGGKSEADSINTRQESLHDKLVEMTEGRGPDVVIEAIGSPATFRAAVEEVAFTGRVVYIGYAKELVSYETRLFVQKELDVLGSRNALPEDFHAVIRMLEARNFPVDQAVSLVVPFEGVGQALRSWSENPSPFKKILVHLD